MCAAIALHYWKTHLTNTFDPLNKLQFFYICHRFIVDSFGFQLYKERQSEQDLRKKISRWQRNVSVTEMCGIFLGANFVSYLVDRDSYSLAIIYEDLLDRPEAIIRLLLQTAMGRVDEENVVAASAALERDSQNGIFGPRGPWTGSAPESDWIKAEEIMRNSMGLPLSFDMTQEELAEVVKTGKLLS